ncbi:MAG TPA: monovalent cation/H+ antiporter subunit A [Burkholderiaceae bacterium]|nr:monovalent cation/H+ antiporter subunit A [Burkholderiaceae bacterium]
MPLTLILALPFAGSVLAATLPSNARNQAAWLAGLIALVCAVLVAVQFPIVAHGGVAQTTLAWLPSLGLNLVLRMDGYAWLFALLVAGMGALIVLYARYYMSPDDPVPRFFSFFLAFMGAMLGVVLSGNIIQLAIFWELTSLSSFMLIAYWHHRSDARRGARMALTITVAGGLCLLAGMLLLGRIVGSYDLGQVLASANRIRASAWYPTVLTLVALGALAKSAQFPFHVWLPNAMAAPTPVSAYLHSATMVKAGVFLLARFWPVLSGTDQWFWIIGGAGLCSLVLGAFAAMFQQDMKGILAYSTISHLGLITLLLGMNSRLALVAAIFHMMNHATFKSSLFMATGIVDHETGTRDLDRLSGLRRTMPVTATLAMVAAAAMAGVPLLNGFISKEMFFAETVFISGHWITRVGLPVAAVVAGAFSVAYSLRFIRQVFFGQPTQDLPHRPHDPPLWMLLPSALLVLACLVVGVLPGLTLGPLLHAAALSILGAEHMPSYDLVVWHGFNLPLAMSMLAMLGGLVLLHLFRGRYRSRPGLTPLLHRLDGRRAFETLLESLDGIAAALFSWTWSPRLQRQVALIVAITIAVALPPLRHGWPAGTLSTSVEPSFIILWIAGTACALGAAATARRHRLTSLALVGGAGLCTCITFAWLSAPDLALTQLAVETVTTILLLLGLRWLPQRAEHNDAARPMTRDLPGMLLAVAGGAGLATLAYAVMTHPQNPGIASYFIEHALPAGGGGNVVNVILVDFRGFDTLGEITVLGIVALTVYALLRRFRPSPESLAVTATTAMPEAMDVPAVLTRLLLPLAGLISIYFLLRGHNLPGGGFVGGLIFATAIIVQYMTSGIAWVESRPRLQPQYWIAAGLLIAGITAVSAWWAARPLLTALTWNPVLPLIGEVHISSVLFFDIGVYMLVIGATMLILIALAHQSLRFHRAPATEPASGTQPAPSGAP